MTNMVEDVLEAPSDGMSKLPAELRARAWLEDSPNTAYGDRRERQYAPLLIRPRSGSATAEWRNDEQAFMSRGLGVDAADGSVRPGFELTSVDRMGLVELRREVERLRARSAAGASSPVVASPSAGEAVDRNSLRSANDGWLQQLESSPSRRRQAIHLPGSHRSLQTRPSTTRNDRLQGGRKMRPLQQPCYLAPRPSRRLSRDVNAPQAGAL
ncbi:Hypothetical predicted protein [Lecanosticta acicola]|uniref:Uncharacterized protein n=1 Tax=Lecanosticta acicola TaxID=111012 RepID=A0AAI8Z938_9PEZI|nr:Hypothetical predicted protein [Lecanosticta acicola]